MPRFDDVFTARVHDADEFYRSIMPSSAGADAANVMRQAFAGMLWSKQYYYLDASRWLGEHGVEPFAPSEAVDRETARGRTWSTPT